MPLPVDLIGMKFGRLLVIEKGIKPDHIKKSYGTYWKCLCDCGNIKTIRGSDLKKGSTRSCGCFRLEKSKEEKANKKTFKAMDLIGQRFGRFDGVLEHQKI